MGRHKIDARILAVLEELGRASLGEISMRLNANRKYVQNRLKVMEEEGLVKKPYRGIYELVKKAPNS